MHEGWQKRILIMAAAWNVIGGARALFIPAQHFAQLYTTSLSFDDPLQRTITTETVSPCPLITR